MKQALLFCLFVLAGSPAVAGVVLSAHCNNEAGKQVDCKVQSADKNLQVTYDFKKYASLNRNIPGSAITRINAGEFTKQRTAEAVLISPLFLLSKRKYENFSVEYTENKKDEFVNISVRQKDAQMMRSILHQVTNKPIEGNSKDNSGVVK